MTKVKESKPVAEDTSQKEVPGVIDLEVKPEASESESAPATEAAPESMSINLEVEVASTSDQAPAATTAAPVVQASNQPGSVINPALGAFRIHSVKTRARYLKALIYGEPGIGKTYLTGTCEDVPAMRDVLMISAESGDMTVADRDFDVIPISNHKQMSRVYEFLKLHVKFRDEENYERLAALQEKFTGVKPTKKSEVRMYRTIIIDSLSEVQKYVMYQLLGIDPQTSKLDEEPTPAQFKEWGQGGDMIRLMVRAFRDLNINVIFVAGLKSKEDEYKKTHFAPNFPGGLGVDIMGFVDLVGFYRLAMDVSDPSKPVRVRRLHISPGAQFPAKSRLRSLDGLTHIDNPVIGDLVKGLV